MGPDFRRSIGISNANPRRKPTAQSQQINPALCANLSSRIRIPPRPRLRCPIFFASLPLSQRGVLLLRPWLDESINDMQVILWYAMRSRKILRYLGTGGEKEVAVFQRRSHNF